jgi:hypothetical protein
MTVVDSKYTRVCVQIQIVNLIIFNDFGRITLLRRDICKTMENPLNTVRQTLLIQSAEVVNEYKDNA